MGEHQPYNLNVIDTLVDHEKIIQRGNVCLLNLEDVRHLESNPRSRDFKDTFAENINSQMTSLVFPVETSTQDGERSHINLVHADGDNAKLTFYGSISNEESRSELERHTKNLAEKVFRKNGSLNDFSVEWKSGYVAGEEDCAVTMLEGMKNSSRKNQSKILTFLHTR